MNDNCAYCQDCDVSIEKWTDFLWHAKQGHAITWGKDVRWSIP